jgi:hypothetical protein
VSAIRSVSSRPLVVSSDEQLLDDVLRLVAAAGAEAEVAHSGPALRRAHREAPLVLVGSDALAGGAVRALPRRPGVVVVTAGELPAAEWARAVELAVAAGPGVLLVDADAWGGGIDLLLGGERVEGLRWPELAGLRGRVAGDALLASLPEVAGVSVLAGSRSSPVVVPEDALTAVAEAARSAGHPVVVDLSRADGAERAVVSEADLALLVVPARLRAATAARLLVDAPGSPWAAARLIVGQVAGGLCQEEVADVVGRPVLAELPYDRSAVARAERGEPPSVGARSPLGRLSRSVLGEVRPRAVAR